MKILGANQVTRKIKRLAIEIYGNHIADELIYFVGINQKGIQLAEMIVQELAKICNLKIKLLAIKIKPANPLLQPVEISIEISQLNGAKIILFDDVSNTGRTFFYACKPFMEIVPNRLEIVALIDRKHKSFPIKIDYVGLSLSTTLHENIEVIFHNKKEVEVFLG